MKNRRSPLLSALALVLLFFLPGQLFAASLTWDANAGGAGQTDGSGTWLNANQWWDGALNQTWNNATPDDAIIGLGGTGGTITLGAVTAGSLTFNSFNGTYTLSSGSLALNNGITSNSGAGNVIISTPVTLGGAQSWTNNSSSLLTMQTGALSLGSNALTVTGSGNTIISSAITGPGGSLIKSGTGTLILSSGSGNYTGGTTLTAGILVLASTTTGTVTSGPIGTGTLAVNGGTLRWGQGSGTVANAMTVGGSAAFDISNGGTSATATLSGGLIIGSTPTLTFTNSGAGTSTSAKFVFSGLTTLNSSSILNINDTVGSDPFVTFSGGFDLNNGNRTITVQTSNSTAKGIAIAGSLKDTGGTGHNLTFNGTNNVTATGIISAGTGNPGIIYSGTGTFDTNAQNSTWIGGYTLNSGTTNINGSSTVLSNAVTQGPFGTGTLTLNGGTLVQGSSSQTIHNSLVIGGSVAFVSPANVAGTSTLTFNPTGVTGGTTTINGAATISSSIGINGGIGLNFNGQILGANTPSLTIKGGIYGIGPVTLINSSGSASTFGNVNIGDTVSTGSVGGSLGVQSQNAMGSGSYTINYGGTLSLTTNSFNPTNAITVNNGGTFRAASGVVANQPLFGSTTAATVFNSGSTLNQSSGATAIATAGTSAGQVSFPAAGVLLLNSANSLTVTGKYPDLTGTLAIGGVQSAGTTTFSTATGITADRTLAVNTTGGGTLVFGGMSLSGGNLTVAGTGNGGLTGLVPLTANGNLGTITETGSRSITIAMAPTGAVELNETSTGWTGGTTVTGGTLLVSAASYNAKAFGSAGVTLNGGALRVVGTNNTQGFTAQDAITVRAAGGRLEAGGTSGTTGQGYSGNISDFSGSETGNVVLSAGNMAGGSGTLLTLSGNNTGFTGGFSISPFSGGANVRFSGADSLGATTNAITVAKGAVFGFTFTPTTAQMNQFTTDTESVLALDNLTSIDLSGTGYNKDLRLGNFGVSGGGGTSPLVFSGAITPYGSDYRLTASVHASLTISGVNTFNGARNLDVAAIAVAPGAVSNSSGTLSITASQNYSGNTTVSGVMRNSLMAVGASGITLNIGSGGNLGNSTTFAVGRGATLALAGTNGTISSINPAFAVQSGGTLRIGSTTVAENNGVTNRVSTTGDITLGGSEGGGTLTMGFAGAGNTTSQTLDKLTVNAGLNSINTTGANGTTLNLTFAGGADGYVRNVGGLVNQTTATGFNLGFAAAPTGTSVIGGIIVGATINNADFVSAASGNWAAPTYTTQSLVGSWTSGQNITANGTAGFSGTTTTGLSINSLRNTSATGSSTVTVLDTLTIGSGMILNTANQAFAINGGNLTSGNGQDLMIANTANTLTIGSKITGNLALTKSGAGTLTLGNATNAIGDVYALGGTTIVNATGALATATARTIYLQGGTVQFASIGNFTNTAINVGGAAGTNSAGGNINTNANGAVTFGGNVTLNGALGLGSPSGGNPTTLTFSGNLAGAGLVGIGKQSDGKNTVVFSGNNTAWTGGVRFDTAYANSGGGNTHLRFSPSAAGYNSSGTGPINLVSANTLGGIYFDTTDAGSTTFVNDVINNVGNLPIVAWGLSNGLGNGTANTTTLSGKFIGNQGLTLQGYATSDTAISEMVLSGTVSVSGASGGYSYGNANFAQNFNNGQGGITSGVTQYRTLTLQGTGNVPLVDLPSGQAVNGAEGFVRFDGVNSFIPGAVGPGYLSALRKAGGGQDGRFGYLLTGTSGNGTTYALPEGKSFVIGSLGTGTQQYGTLGTTGTGNNTAILTGSNKLVGFEAGDVNIHGNAVADTQSLNLLARNTGDTLQLGTSGQGVVFSPTYGDSGATSSVTLMATRTGATTINKIGAGTVEVVNAHFNNVGGATDSAKSGFTLNVNAGTLKYSQVDTGAKYAALNVSAGATLTGSGTINSTAITVDGIVAPGSSIGTLSISDSVTWNSNDSNDWKFDLGTGAASLAAANTSTDSDLLNILSGAFIKGTDTGITGYAFNFQNTGSIGWYKLVDFTANTGGFAASDFTASNLLTGTATFVLDPTTSALYLNVVPEPATWALLAFSLTTVMVLRRRRE